METRAPNHRRPSSPLLLALFLFALLAHAQNVAIGADLRNGFESTQSTWQAGEGDVRYRTVTHRRLHGDSHAGEWCEEVLIEAGNGTFVHFQHDIGHALIMEGVVPSIWLKANRPGARLMVRAVLPKAIDAKSGRPLTVLLLGDQYKESNVWSKLEVRDVEKQLLRQQRVERQKRQEDISIEDAYLDLAVVNIYAGEGQNHVRLDDLEVRQYVDYADVMRQRQPTTAENSPLTWGDPEKRKVLVERRGSMLYVDKIPFAARILDHQGESFDLVRRLGFNTVRLGKAPTAEQLADARRNQLLLICPADESSQQVASRFDSAPILAWDVTAHPDVMDSHGSARLASLGSHPNSLEGLTVGLSATQLPSQPKPDFSLDGQPDLQMGWSWSAHARWHDSLSSGVSRSPRGWSRIASEYPRALNDQLLAFGVLHASLPGPTSDNLRMRMRWALVNGARGLVLESTVPFSENVTNSYRAAAIEQANLDLQMLHPWMSNGRVTMTLETTWPWIKAVVMEVQHAKLLLFVLVNDPSPTPATESLSVIVPGIPESSKAHVLTPAGFEPVQGQSRVAGGTRIELAQGDPLQCVVLAHHPHVVSGLDAFLRTSRARAAQLERRLLAESLTSLQRSSTSSSGDATIQDLLTQVTGKLSECDRLMTQGQVYESYQAARYGNQLGEALRRELMDKAVIATGPRVSCPLSMTAETLPVHYQWLQFVRQARLGDAVLAGGEFEDLSTMQQAGWKHFHQDESQFPAGAELSLDAPHTGRRSLRLDVKPNKDIPTTVVIESPPTWIESPPVVVRQGDLVVVDGWVRIPKPLQSTIDGLMVYDSIGGEALALHIHHTEGWQRFLLIRRPRQDGELTITMALAGIGEAWLDDVTVRVASTLRPPPAASFGPR